MNPDHPSISTGQDPAPAVPPVPLPYASPTPLAILGNVFRENALLVARDGAELPARCIFCGQPGDGKPLPLVFTWDSSFTVTRDSTLQLRQKVSLAAYLCALHRGRFSTGRILGGLGIGASTGLMVAGAIVGIVSESSVAPVYTPFGILLMIVGFAGMIASLFFFTLRTRTLHCLRIEAGYAYLEGAGEAFLAQITELPRE